ncbi:AfsR/SARP family transcriptional regulator [Kutzneria kofuensis]
MHIGVLGMLQAGVGDTPIAIGGSRQRTILAMLALAPGQVVSVDALVEAVWNGRPPATGRTQVAICVAALRKTVKATGFPDDVIITSAPGYLLRTDNVLIDAVEFAELTAAGETAAEAGDLVEAARCLDAALKLWRGPALTGVSGLSVEIEAARLEELRLTAHEKHAAIRLDLGQHNDLIGELTTLVREHPLREQARAQLMLAQYRAGRRAESLATFRDGQRLSINEFGLELGPALRKMHDAILRDDPMLSAAASRPARTSGSRLRQRVRPAQLPADVQGFTGRADEIAALDRMVDDAGLTIGLITGGAGVGKTGLAVHWAHRVADEFPDGQLFADVSAGAKAVLGGFLRALGVPDDLIHDDVEERAALYRSILRDRQALVVLDNASSFAEIRPLLPGSPQCHVLVTSRGQLYDLLGKHGARQLRLGALAPADAVSLLGSVAGTDRVTADPAAAHQLAELCDRLPLVLRTAGARLAAKPHWSVRHLLDKVADEAHRLDELSGAEHDLRAGFAASCRELTEPEAALFRRLGLLTVPEVSVWIGAALLDTTANRAEKHMERLVDLQLLDVVGTDATGGVRYRQPELIRLYARELCEEHDSRQVRVGACERVFSGWLSMAVDGRRSTGFDGQRLEELLRDPSTLFDVPADAIPSLRAY